MREKKKRILSICHDIKDIPFWTLHSLLNLTGDENEHTNLFDSIQFNLFFLELVYKLPIYYKNEYLCMNEEQSNIHLMSRLHCQGLSLKRNAFRESISWIYWVYGLH